eukprot:gnl/TRDRNA2_/TRDRNA2_78509_c0_seq1.p1 gnl/TRDRNA2_/TRDRNA2_78509_c0~~gnl/TRDRNA2_/TRDRNA2_78509_c0_seq1.p1  ORF type:complete len:130 (-),score=10.09 gnl/TRDRNA2_/TRDRNA2_78509_c0_seq1:94-483(-)
MVLWTSLKKPAAPHGRESHVREPCISRSRIVKKHTDKCDNAKYFMRLAATVHLEEARMLLIVKDLITMTWAAYSTGSTCYGRRVRLARALRTIKDLTDMTWAFWQNSTPGRLNDSENAYACICSTPQCA